jgi:hypothetical protein
MHTFLSKYFFNYKTITLFLGIIVLIASFQSYFAPLSLYKNNLEYTHYNNYIIFKQSFSHLIHNKDLFIHYPYEYWDLYKYSPTFAMLFAPFAAIPDLLGLILWNLLNALAVFIVFRYFPAINDRTKIAMLWFVFLELFTCLQNEQSNGIVAGLIIGSFILLERKQFFLAALCIVSTVFIKLFGIVAFSLLLLYPNKIRNILFSFFWAILLAALPLLVISFSQLKFQYLSWWNVLVADHTLWDGLSVMGWLNKWFGFHPDKLYILLAGMIIFCIPLVRYKLYTNFLFKTFVLSSVLIWVVIFNHKAESPTYIIAISGVALWFFSQERKTENLALIILAFIFTILAPTDLFPRWIRMEILKPYVVKAVPCILLWLKIINDLWVCKQKAPESRSFS